jgi:hypothetical protein
LIEHGEGFRGEGVTPVLIASRAAQPTLAQRARGAMAVVSANSEQARSWFQFDPLVDFSRCTPAEQMQAMVR